MVSTMLGKTAQPSPRIKPAAIHGRHQQKDEGRGNGEIFLARSSSTSHQSSLWYPKRDADISSAQFTKNLTAEDRLNGGTKEKRTRDPARRGSTERRRERAYAEDERQQSKAGKFKNKMRSGGMRKEREHETPTERDGTTAASAGDRVVPNMSQKTPSKRRVFKHGDFPGKPQHRSKSTPRQHPDLHIDSSLLAGPELPNETNREKMYSGTSAGEATSPGNKASQQHGEDTTSPGTIVGTQHPSSHRRLGPRATTASDLFAILSPRKKGGGQGSSRNLSPFNTTVPSVQSGIAQAIDLSDNTSENDLHDDDSLPTKRGGIKLQKKTIRRKNDRVEKLSNSTSVASNMSSMCPQCAADSSSTRSMDVDTDKAAIDDKITNSLEIQELRQQLDECELEIQAIVSTAARNEELFRAEIERFESILGTVDQAQELRYHSLLEVFTDNFKTMGTVEARFEQMLGARHGQMQTSSRGRLLQFLWVLVDLSVKALFQIAQTIYKTHKFIKGRR